MLADLEAKLKSVVKRDGLAFKLLHLGNLAVIGVRSCVDRARQAAKQAYRLRTKSSIFWESSELGMCSLFPEKKLAKALELFKPRTVLDVGCGTGRALDYFLEHGVEAQGVEGSALAIQRARNPSRILQFDLNQELDLKKKVDLLWSFEFVEHIHPEYVPQLLKTFSNHSDTIVMSAARPGQGGEGHFNEQPFEYWIEKFRGIGYAFDAELAGEFRRIDELFSENMLVFKRV